MLHGVDVDAGAVDAARVALAGRGEVVVEVGDALDRDWGDDRRTTWSLGNPPYLSQLAAATSRGRSSASRAAARTPTPPPSSSSWPSVSPGRAAGASGCVLPQSILGSRDAGPVRARVEQLAEPIWSWWSPRLHFDASVFVAPSASDDATARPGTSARDALGGDREPVWTGVVTRAMGIPDLPAVAAAGCVGDRATVTANFRDEYYGLIPAVGDHRAGPPFVTSGAIDPDRCRWGERPVTFNRRRFERPRVDVSTDSTSGCAAGPTGWPCRRC